MTGIVQYLKIFKVCKSTKKKWSGASWQWLFARFADKPMQWGMNYHSTLHKNIPLLSQQKEPMSRKG